MVASHTADSIRVKLADPGIPSYIDDEYIYISKTILKSLKLPLCCVHRLPWIPIELFGSLEAIHRRSSADIWACGTVMWEIFSGGRKPFTAFAKRSKPQMIQVKYLTLEPEALVSDYTIFIRLLLMDGGYRDLNHVVEKSTKLCSTLGLLILP